MPQGLCVREKSDACDETSAKIAKGNASVFATGSDALKQRSQEKMASQLKRLCANRRRRGANTNLHNDLSFQIATFVHHVFGAIFESISKQPCKDHRQVGMNVPVALASHSSCRVMPNSSRFGLSHVHASLYQVRYPSRSLTTIENPMLKRLYDVVMAKNFESFFESGVAMNYSRRLLRDWHARYFR
ncbi:hypothetical protein C0J52_07458 [Blattella germanica]|nr:hypothetical protein C0J52_07458 [Blattella germanica]